MNPSTPVNTQLIRDNLHTGDTARQSMIEGIKKIADAVGSTMGTAGSNAVIQMVESPGHLLTNDGFTIASSIELKDPLERMGKTILMEAIQRANKASGDGSSTTTVLTHAILREGIACEGIHPMEIKRSLEACLPIVEENLKKMAKTIDISELAPVATISAEDSEIGARIQEIYSIIGKDGIIQWDVSKTGADYFTIGNGLAIEESGIASPYMFDRDPQTGGISNVAKMKDARVIVTTEKITTGAVFENIFSELNKKGDTNVVIFCSEYDATVIGHLLMTYQARGFRAVIAKIPVLWSDEWKEDIAQATGAMIISSTRGIGLDQITLDHVGTIPHITIDKTTVYLDGITDLTTHIQKLKEENTDASLLRASRLSTKTARYYVGALSDSALSYRRLKVEDAIAAAHHALNGGIVPGGGVALMEIIKDLPDSIGGEILAAACMEPAFRIATNAGHEFHIENYTKNYGLNTTTGLFVNMFDAQIVDPYQVVLNAVKNAVSVAGNILTAHTLVTFPEYQ